MSYDPNSLSAKHQYVDDQIAAAVTLVNDNPYVSMAVGPIVIDSVNRLSDSYFVPNEDDSLVTLTKTQKRTDGIAVIAVDRDETVRISEDFAHYSPDQQESILRALADYGLSDDDAYDELDDLERITQRQHRGTFMPVNLKTAGAFAAAASLYQPFHSPLLGKAFMGRPRGLLILGMTAPGQDVLSDDTVVHEDAHIEDMLQTPLLPIPDIPYGHEMVNLSEERKVYGIQGEILRAKRASGIPLRVHDQVILEVPAIIRSIQAEVVGTEINPIVLLHEKAQARRNELEASY